MRAVRSLETTNTTVSSTGHRQGNRARNGSHARRPRAIEASRVTPHACLLNRNEREQLILAHQEFAENIAWKILKRWQVRLERDDIRSAAALALCAAAQTFDSSRGIAFSTLLFHHVRGVLLKHIARSAKQQQVREAAQRVFNDPEVSDAETEVVKPNHFPAPDAALLADEKRLQCQRALQELVPLERQVMEEWMYEGKSIVEIAKTLGYSRGHVSRIKTFALSKLARILSSC